MRTAHRGHIDGQGVDVGLLAFSRALSEVRDLEKRGMADEDDLARNPRLLPASEHEQAALEIVNRLLGDAGWLDGLEPSAARDWPREATDANGVSDDSSRASDAVRVILSLARASQSEPSDVRGIRGADGFDRDQVCIDMVGDLLGMHGDRLDARPGRLPSPRAG